jgi:hypothetical protein
MEHDDGSSGSSGNMQWHQRFLIEPCGCSSGSSWNMVLAPVVPHGTWQWHQRFLMECVDGPSGSSCNMVVAPVDPHGTW